MLSGCPAILTVLQVIVLAQSQLPALIPAAYTNLSKAILAGNAAEVEKFYSPGGIWESPTGERLNSRQMRVVYGANFKQAASIVAQSVVVGSPKFSDNGNRVVLPVTYSYTFKMFDPESRAVATFSVYEEALDEWRRFDGSWRMAVSQVNLQRTYRNQQVVKELKRAEVSSE
jgi:hypothetical protein